MKKISIIIIGITTLFAVGCTKNASVSLNKNPKASSTGIGTALFLQGEFNLTNTLTSTSVSSAPFRVISQEWTENSYVYEANYNLTYYNSPGGFWNNMYVNAIHNLDLAKQAFPNDFLGTPGELRNDIIICDILEVDAYYTLMATYGDIPYSQAENVDIPFPKFDAAKTVYADLLTRIDTCIAGLDPSQDAMGSADLIYGGTVSAWVKFAASLKLKMALLNAKSDPTTTAAKVNEAIATGVFTSDADDALFSYDPASPTNSNPIWQAIFYSSRHDFGPAALLVNTMLAVSDPRLPNYFTQSGGSYVGGVAGNPGNSYGNYSDFCCVATATLLYNPSLQGNLLDYSQVEFYLAEAAAQNFLTGGLTTAQYYNAAITSSIEFWGGSASDATTYLALPTVNYTTLIASQPWQQVIGYQEFIANYNHNWDSWTDERRLGYPNINVVSPPQSPSSNFPLRYPYPPNETTSNSANTAAAVANLPGGLDSQVAALFWE